MLLQVAKAAKHDQHVASCVVRVLLLPGAGTAQELAAAVARLHDKHGDGAGSSRSAGGSRLSSGSIRNFFKPQLKQEAATEAAVGGSNSTGQQQQQQQLCEADLVAAGATVHYLLVQRPDSGLLAGLWEFPGVLAW